MGTLQCLGNFFVARLLVLRHKHYQVQCAFYQKCPLPPTAQLAEGCPVKGRDRKPVVSTSTGFAR